MGDHSSRKMLETLSELLEDKPTVITGVALRSPEGLVVALPRPARHHQLYALMALVDPKADFTNAIEGFMTRFGVFVSRKAAFQLVEINGQPNRRSGSSTSIELYSEDVW